jgi:hypothetical protein
MTNQQHDYSNPPDWATPEAWAAVEKIVDRAKKNYDRLLRESQEKLLRDHWGEYIVIASYLPLRYVVAKKELDADNAFKAKYPRIKSAALFQIGCI